MSTLNENIETVALSVRDARKSFGDVQVLQGIDLDIRVGERVA